MLCELQISDLGPVDHLQLLLDDGFTVLTGETGAGKTVLTDAIALLRGGQADSSMVRTGAAEASVEGRFVTAEGELVVCRVVPASGRSRAYVDGHIASVAELAERVGDRTVIFGQNGHQQLLRPAAQRRLLDQYAGTDLEPLHEAREALRDLLARRDELGGDSRTRAREIELYRFQLEELERVGIEDASEDERLQGQEKTLANAADLKAVGHAQANQLGPENAAGMLSTAVAALDGLEPYRELHERLVGVEAELIDISRELADSAEQLEEDPERLHQVQQRRSQLTELRRKYGDSLAEVIEYQDAASKRLAELIEHDSIAETIDADITAAQQVLADAESAVLKVRKTHAPKLAKAIQDRVRTLALPNASVAVSVSEEGAGDQVTLMVAMNSGGELAPLTKVASGGELSRTMLAIALELSDGPATMVFDEVDAGVGGEAATSIAEALAGLAVDSQVLVVTHLPQVAAAAATQVKIHKQDDGRSTSVSAEVLGPDERPLEIARMMSGEPDSATAIEHSKELLAKRSAR